MQSAVAAVVAVVLPVLWGQWPCALLCHVHVYCR